MKVEVGDKVREGSLVLVLEAAAPAEGSQPAPAPVQAAAPTPSSAAALASAPAPATTSAPTPAPAASGGGAGNVVDVVVPDIGDFDQVAVIELLVKPGDTVTAEQSLITVESDKASMEIPSSHAGQVQALLVKIGRQRVQGHGDREDRGDRRGTGRCGGIRKRGGSGTGRRGQRFARIDRRTRRLASQPVERTVPTAALPAHEPTAVTGHLPHASPSVRRFARELGVPWPRSRAAASRAASPPKTCRATSSA